MERRQDQTQGASVFKRSSPQSFGSFFERANQHHGERLCVLRAVRALLPVFSDGRSHAFGLAVGVHKWTCGGNLSVRVAAPLGVGN